MKPTLRQLQLGRVHYEDGVLELTPRLQPDLLDLAMPLRVRACTPAGRELFPGTAATGSPLRLTNIPPETGLVEIHLQTPDGEKPFLRAIWLCPLNDFGRLQADDGQRIARQAAKAFERTGADGVTRRGEYTVQFPPDYGNKPAPLLVHLRGKKITHWKPRIDMRRQDDHGGNETALRNQADDFSFLRVDPTCATGTDPAPLDAMLDDIQERFLVDPDRVHVIGWEGGVVKCTCCPTREAADAPALERATSAAWSFFQDASICARTPDRVIELEIPVQPNKNNEDNQE